MKIAPLFILVSALVVPNLAAASQYKSVGYVEEWATARTGHCAFSFSQINPNLYTHLIYAFSAIQAQDGNYTVVSENGADPNSTAQMATAFANFQALKQQNPALKTLISIGGSSFSSDSSTSWIWGTMASSDATRRQFAANAVQFARTYGFDGIDIDWEFPANPQNGGQPQDTANFTYLLDALRDAINGDAQTSGQAPLLLTFAAPATSNDYDNIQLGLVAQVVDWINLMAYDYHGSWESRTGALAPLMMDAAPDSDLDDTHTVQDYMAAGVPSQKIVMGLAAYGATFGNVARNAMNTPSYGGGAPGACSCQPGILSYGEIVEAVAHNQYAADWDPISMTPFAYNAGEGSWVTYENELSLQMKLLYIQGQRLGGGMLWAVDSDDVAHGYPLSSLMAQMLLNQ